MRVSRSTFKLELEVQDSRSKEKVDESEVEIGIDSRQEDTCCSDWQGSKEARSQNQRSENTVAFVLTKTVDKKTKWCMENV